MKRDYKTLLKYYGSHVAAAKAISISPEHYRRMRNQKGGGKWLKAHIKRMAWAIRSGEMK